VSEAPQIIAAKGDDKHPFFFGSEGEDPANAWAFDNKRNPSGAQLQSVYGSDIGHWDCPICHGFSWRPGKRSRKGI